MLLLPQGIPIRETVPVRLTEPPVLLTELRDRNFTGYLRFRFPASASLFLFQRGKLTDALFERGKERFRDLDAITGTFEGIVAGEGSFDAYSLAPRLVNGLRALFRGTPLAQGKRLSEIDVRALLARFKTEGLSGCLRVYTDGRSAMIFYREGTPLGFFHNGSTQIEQTADGYLNVAALPGASIDAFTAHASDTATFDLEDVIDLEKIWSVIRDRQLRDSARRRQAS